MKKILFFLLSLGTIIVSGCGSSTTTTSEYNDDTPYTASNTIEDTSKPTIMTEIPTTTSEEIVTQADSDTSL